MKWVKPAVIIAAAASVVIPFSLSAPAGADTPPVISSPHTEVFSDLLPDGTNTYASFHCDDGPNSVLTSAVAYRQIGSSTAVPLGLLDYTSNTYPEGVVVSMINDTGHDEYYRVTLICGTAIEN